ncbi:MAG: ABC transporter permease [Cytophagales bacterium]
MLTNYLKTAIRSLFKQRIYTLINVVGLVVSITACLLLGLYVHYELSYDKFFNDADRIYKLVLERKYPNHSTYYASIPHSYSMVAQKDFPEIEKTLLMFGGGNNANIKYKESETRVKTFEEDHFVFADSNFFDFFDVGLILGDKQTALAKLNQVVISSSAANRFFGNDDPLGKTLFGDLGEMKVTGVFDDLPENSHLRFDAVVSVSGEQLRRQENFISFDSYTYLKLKPNTSASALEAKFPRMVDTYASGQIEQQLGQSWEDYKKAGNGYRYFLQPLTSIHLDPRNIEFTNTPSGNRNNIYALVFIGSLILAIACINFMNLATARSSERAREVVVRKVMGSLRSQLVAQFLTEAVLLSLFGAVLAVGCAYLLLPSFNLLVEKKLLLAINGVFAGLAIVALFIGIAAGLYPALVLSGFSPVTVMKGNFSGSNKGSWLRGGLVVFQFMISIVLIISTLVVKDQMEFIRKKDLGFSHEQILVVDQAFRLDKKTEAFKNELKKIPEVMAVAGTSSRIGNRNDVFGQMFQPYGSNEVLTVKSIVLDDEFTELIKFNLLEGRSFSKNTNDSLHILLNESAVKTLGLTDPIGGKLSNADLFRGDSVRDAQRHFIIVGVVKNFHFQSLHDEITPLVMFNREVFGKQSGIGFLAVKLKKQSPEVVSQIESIWKQLVPEFAFHYEYLDKNLEHGYKEEAKAEQMYTIFSGLAIIIAGVGLFGLSAYSASLRTKEIGIRKVLGSSVAGIVILLSKEFATLVAFAFLLSVPLAWWMMNEWLKGFAYHINLGFSAFILAGFIAFIIAWLTVSYQSVKAAIQSPVKSLKQN